MKKCLKSLVIMSCLAASVHNGDASSFSRRMGFGSKVAAMVAVPVTAYVVWDQNTSPVIIPTSPTSEVPASFFTMNGAWTQYMRLFATPATISTPPKTTPKDCGCNACPHTLANKPLSREASDLALQELRQLKPSVPHDKISILTNNQMTPKQWYTILRKISTEQIVPSCGLYDHHREFDATLKRMLSESDYNALVEAGIYQPLTPVELNALKIITSD